MVVQKGMKMGNRFGTESNPIVLIPEVSNPSLQHNDIYAAREHLLAFSKLGILEQNITDVARRANEYRFVMNIISNPYLKPLEIKVALFFYEEHSFGYGDFFVVSDRETNKAKFSELGGKDFFYSRNLRRYMDVDVHSKSEITNLVSILSDKLNLNIPASRLIDCLQRLHGFGYITMTKINFYNSEYGIAELKNMIDNGVEHSECLAKTSSDSIVKHIRVSNYMGRCDLSNKWLTKAKAKK
jgi:hypothetical protein